MVRDEMERIIRVAVDEAVDLERESWQAYTEWLEYQLESVCEEARVPRPRYSKEWGR